MTLPPYVQQDFDWVFVFQSEQSAPRPVMTEVCERRPEALAVRVTRPSGRFLQTFSVTIPPRLKLSAAAVPFGTSLLRRTT
jgi:hypothetical protein